jgi:hypothetical protein
MNVVRSNKWLLTEMERCRSSGNVISPELGQMFIDLCTRWVKRQGYAGLTYQDDMIAHAVTQLCADWSNFDPSKSNNPFAYLTQIAVGAFCVYTSREHKQQDIAPVSLQ